LVPSSFRADDFVSFSLCTSIAVLLTLVDNVPVRAFALVTSHDGLDVILHNAHQCGVIVNLVHPVWQLRVPDESVASHLLVILCREVGDLVGATKAELSSVGFRCVPLHSILRCDGAELRFDDVGFLVVVADRQ
jgi:hypothetical protein